jgi:hypothetical protein
VAVTLIEVLAMVTPVLTVGAVVWNARGAQAKVELTQQTLDSKVTAVAVSVDTLAKSVSSLEKTAEAIKAVPLHEERIAELRRIVNEVHSEKLEEHGEKLQKLTVTVERISLEPGRARLSSQHGE